MILTHLLLFFTGASSVEVIPPLAWKPVMPEQMWPAVWAPRDNRSVAPVLTPAAPAALTGWIPILPEQIFPKRVYPPSAMAAALATTSPLPPRSFGAIMEAVLRPERVGRMVPSGFTPGIG